MEDNSDLRIYANGKAFQDGIYDLRSLELLVSNYRVILDRLVAVQLGRRQVPKGSERQLNYEVQIKDGSIELLIKFALEHPEFVAFLSLDGGYQLSETVVRLYKGAIDLRKAAARFIENGVTFNISITNSFNVGSNNISADENSGQISISDPKILWAAQMTRAPTDRLLKRIDGQKIRYMDLRSRESEFRLGAEDRTILGRDKEELDAEINIVGRLDMIAFTSHRGTIVSEGESFPVTWGDDLRSKMQKMADIEDIVFRVRPVIDNSRLNRDAIGFHVLDCRTLQQGFWPNRSS